MHLKFCYIKASRCGELRHAQEVMKDLGIEYTHSTPQSMGEQFWFWNCSNLPDKIPSFLGKLENDPMKCIGFGLSKEEATEVVKGIKE